MEGSPGPRSQGGRSLLAHPEVREAWARVQAMDDWVIQRQVELTTIPAPPFGEGPRSERMAELFLEVGLRNVRRDEVGNVMGLLPASKGEPPEVSSDPPPLVVSAHLDTVFPPGTPVTPKREGDRIEAPGISDDGRGLAALLALARILLESSLPLPYPLLFVATVGEEGPGDLRGVRHLLVDGEDVIHPRGFISLDGVGMDRIITRGVGSTRLRVRLTGSGGHSWTDFGRVNPIHALGRVVAEAQMLTLPQDPKCSLTIARWGGGTSINSIPREAWLEVDIRSEAGPQLETIEREFVGICRKALDARALRGPPTGVLSLEITEIGRRPAGSTPHTHPLVESAREATRLLGEEPILVASSTDANLPMSIGIPAITMGAGGVGGGIHTTDEWYGNRKGPEGIFRALLTLLLFA